jgi:hypothetical protein
MGQFPYECDRCGGGDERCGRDEDGHPKDCTGGQLCWEPHCVIFLDRTQAQPHLNAEASAFLSDIEKTLPETQPAAELVCLGPAVYSAYGYATPACIRLGTKIMFADAEKAECVEGRLEHKDADDVEFASAILVRIRCRTCCGSNNIASVIPARWRASTPAVTAPPQTTAAVAPASAASAAPATITPAIRIVDEWEFANQGISDFGWGMIGLWGDKVTLVGHLRGQERTRDEVTGEWMYFFSSRIESKHWDEEQKMTYVETESGSRYYLGTRCPAELRVHKHARLPYFLSEFKEPEEEAADDEERASSQKAKKKHKAKKGDKRKHVPTPSSDAATTSKDEPRKSEAKL